MSLVIPAILAKSLPELKEQIEVLQGLPAISTVQIDICDGNYVDNTTWPYEGAAGGEGWRKNLDTTLGEEAMLPYASEMHYQIDLMVAKPEQVIGEWIGRGATTLIVHVESTDNFADIIHQMKHEYGYDKDFAPGLLSLGMAVSLGTPIEKYKEFVGDIDFVQFMGIQRLGHQGQAFDERVVKKIREFRKRFPEQRIQVDGGVSLESASKLLDAGVDHLAVGSALFKNQRVTENIKKFEKLAEQHGIYE